MQARLFRIVMAVVAGVASLIAYYVVTYDEWPPHSPQKVLRLISGLPVPRSSTVLESFDMGFWTLSPTIEVRVRVEVAESKLQGVLAAARDMGYESLPVPADSARTTILREFMDPTLAGLYLAEISSTGRRFRVIVVDSARRQVLAMKSSG